MHCSIKLKAYTGVMGWWMRLATFLVCCIATVVTLTIPCVLLTRDDDAHSFLIVANGDKCLVILPCGAHQATCDVGFAACDSADARQRWKPHPALQGLWNPASDRMLYEGWEGGVRAGPASAPPSRVLMQRYSDDSVSIFSHNWKTGQTPPFLNADQAPLYGAYLVPNQSNAVWAPYRTQDNAPVPTPDALPPQANLHTVAV